MVAAQRLLRALLKRRKSLDDEAAFIAISLCHRKGLVLPQASNSLGCWELLGKLSQILIFPNMSCSPGNKKVGINNVKRKAIVVTMQG